MLGFVVPIPSELSLGPLLEYAGETMKKQSNTRRAGKQAKTVKTRNATPTTGDWRAEMLAQVRALIMQAESKVVEERKWRKPSNAMAGVPVWSCNGIICTGETYKSVVKLTFAKGAALEDPAHLFNASLEGGTRRAIDLHEDDRINERAFKALIRAAVALNTLPRAKADAPNPAMHKARMHANSTPKRRSQKAAGPRLLSGGNPQIAKGDGDASVRAYIAAMPDWKRDIGRRLDALISRAVPDVRKAVKWNSSFYGLAGQGWFLAFHVFARYVKVAFFRGASLQPVPPGGTGKDARWIDIHEGEFNETQLMRWVKQACTLPGWGKS